MTELILLLVGFAIGYFTMLLINYVNDEWPFCKEWWVDEDL